jgi:hypothetical protein
MDILNEIRSSEIELNFYTHRLCLLLSDIIFSIAIIVL